jgi:hypothetical protein
MTVTGLCKKAPQNGKRKHQRKVGRTYHHVLATWAPPLHPGWLVLVAQQLDEYAVLPDITLLCLRMNTAQWPVPQALKTLPAALSAN